MKTPSEIDGKHYTYLSYNNIFMITRRVQKQLHHRIQVCFTFWGNKYMRQIMYSNHLKKCIQRTLKFLQFTNFLKKYIYIIMHIIL